ncbi:ribbon-helix-helix domain-containing protein [Cellulomonas hominis]
MSVTTIKLDSDLRDRLNTEARRRGVSAGSFVEELFAAWLREQRFAAMRTAMAATPVDLSHSYDVEVELFDTTVADGLVPDLRTVR